MFLVRESRPHILTGLVTLALTKILSFFENRQHSKARDELSSKLDACEKRIAALEEHIFNLLTRSK